MRCDDALITLDISAADNGSVFFVLHRIIGVPSVAPGIAWLTKKFLLFHHLITYQARDMSLFGQTGEDHEGANEERKREKKKKYCINERMSQMPRALSLFLARRHRDTRARGDRLKQNFMSLFMVCTREHSLGLF
jgi:hypothetical protein